VSLPPPGRPRESALSRAWTGPRPTTPCAWTSPGAAVDRLTIVHTQAGLNKLVRRLLATGDSEVGIERPDGPVVDALLKAELTVLHHSARSLKHLRHGTARPGTMSWAVYARGVQGR